MEKTVCPAIGQLTEKNMQELSMKKIFWGHQSVGQNILDGIIKLMQGNKSIKLNIVKTDCPDAFSRPIFAHVDIGRNDDPYSKINAFRDYMQKGIGNKVDIAFFKFCFWDIRGKTDIKRVFDTYKTTLFELKAEYPGVIFVHFTVPLMVHADGLKDRIRRVLNLENDSDLDNIRRNELNNLLLAEYSGKEPIFDIASAESTLPGGSRSSFSKDGKTYYCLAQEYSSDGGHLNELGKKVVAERLLIFLSKLSDSNRRGPA